MVEAHFPFFFGVLIFYDLVEFPLSLTLKYKDRYQINNVMNKNYMCNISVYLLYNALHCL